MNKLFAITAVSFLSLASLSISIMPSEANTTTAQLKNKSFNLTKECRAAITTAKNRLEKNRQLQVFQSPISELGGSEHPQGRPHMQSFFMRGAVVGAMMNSPVLLNSIATPIINTCGSISLVRFGAHQTDSIKDLGLMPSGKVVLFKCPNSSGRPPLRRLRWGESC